MVSVADTTERIPVGDRVTIYRRGVKGTYTADFWHSGQHVRKSLRTSNQKIAFQRATKLAAELTGGQYQAEAQTMIPSAVEKYIAYLQIENRAPRTITRYRGELNTFANFAEAGGARKMTGVTMSLLDQYRAERAIDHEPATIYHETVIIKQLFKWARRRGLVTINPIADYELNKPPRKVKPVLTLDQVNATLRQCTVRQGRMIATLAFTGMRVGSLQAIRQDDVDLGGGWITIDDVKKQQRIKLPIHPRLLTVLKAMPSQPHELLFTAEPSTTFPNGGGSIRPDRLNDYFKAAAARAGITGFTLHSLRHFFKSFCVNNRVPERAVDQWLGHSDGSVRAIYYHLTDEDSKRFMNDVPFGAGDDCQQDDEGRSGQRRNSSGDQR